MNRLVKIISVLLATGISAGASGQADAPHDARPPPVEGFVDLHSHLMGEFAFGGGWFSGRIDGAVDNAVVRCNGGSVWGHTHADMRWPLLEEFVAPYDGGWHLGRRRGYDDRECNYIDFIFFEVEIPGTCPKPHFEKWPHSEAIAHQQMWEGWIDEARDGGMKILVASLYESNLLCNAVDPENQIYDCNEMNSIERQANGAWNFVQNNVSKVAIALSASHARDIIADGKLAIVLSAELSYLFPEGDFIPQLDEFHDLGIRSVQVTHHANNRFAGAAPLPEVVGAARLVESIPFVPNLTAIDDFDCEGGIFPNYCNPNPIGLTDEGEELVQAMMDRGMILDVAHVSRVAFNDMHSMAMDNGKYPLLHSHAHFWDTVIPTNDGKTHHEKYVTLEEIEKIKETYGMVGLRTGPEYTFHEAGAPNPAVCQGSSRSFAQSLKYAVDLDLNIGFGADFNGFIKQAKACGSVTSDNELRDKGLAHIGLLPAFLQDMENAGLDSEYVDHIRKDSAENFLRLWGRSENIGTNPTTIPEEPTATCSMTTEVLPDTGDFLSNITLISAQFNASSSSANGIGNTIISYEWSYGGFSFGAVSGSPYGSHLYHNAPLGGSITWYPKVRVTDIYGQSTIADCGVIDIN